MAETAQRKLAAILAADVAGYSRLMERDEEATLATLKAYRAVIDGLVADHGGRVFNSAGDSVVAEFPSPVEAVRCAVDIQTDLAKRGGDTSADQRMRFRMGVNLGDVIVEGDNLYGDGVNVAARLEGLADPGGVCVSRTVYEIVEDKLGLAFEDLGDRSVKNIARPVRAYGLRLDGSRPGQGRRRRRYRRVVVWALLLVAAIGVALALAPTKNEGPGGVPTVAVAPFGDIGGGEAQFSAGLTEDVMVALAAKTEWRVISGGDANGDFTADYRLEGNVRQVDEKLRITASLIATDDGYHVWGGRYDRAAQDTLVVQDEVAGKIVASLAAELATAEAARKAGGQSIVVRALAAVGRLGERTLAFTARLLGSLFFGGASGAGFVQTSSIGALNDD